MERWFTADTHFGHEKMITLAKRPYSSVEEMDEDFIRRWNEVVRPGDIVYVLGDFGMRMREGSAKAIYKRLNGQKMLVVGNHDLKNKHDVLSLKWAWQGDRKVIKIDGQKIVLDHYPLQAWDGSMRASWNLYGHVHGNLPEHQTCLKMDVGVDAAPFGEKLYRPISFEEVRSVMSQREFVPPDRRQVYYEEDLA